jgi:pheromone shutdown protein TraB
MKELAKDFPSLWHPLITERDLYLVHSLQQAAKKHKVIQGTFREHSGNIQGTFREHSGNIQRTFRERSGNIQRTCSEHSANI